MAAITPTAGLTYGSHLAVRTATAQADTGQTDWIWTPAWAKSASVWVNWTAKAGTSPLIDFALKEADPRALNDTYSMALAGWNGITQLTDTGTVVVQIGPGITGIADDDTGDVYHLNTVLPSLMGLVTTLDRTGQTEVQTITVGSVTAGDLFSLTCEGTDTVDFVAGTNMTAAAIQAALRTASGNASLTVTGDDDAGPFIVTWVGETTDQALLVVKHLTGMTASVATTTPGGPDQTYTYTVAVEYHA